MLSRRTYIKKGLISPLLLATYKVAIFGDQIMIPPLVMKAARVCNDLPTNKQTIGYRWALAAISVVRIMSLLSIGPLSRISMPSTL